MTPWTVAHQAPVSMGFSRQEYWSGLPCPSPGDLPDPGIKPQSPAFQADSLRFEPQRRWSGPSPQPLLPQNAERIQVEEMRLHQGLASQPCLPLCDCRPGEWFGQLGSSYPLMSKAIWFRGLGPNHASSCIPLLAPCGWLSCVRPAHPGIRREAGCTLAYRLRDRGFQEEARDCMETQQLLRTILPKSSHAFPDLGKHSIRPRGWDTG